MGLPMLTMGLATQGIKTVDNILVLKLLNFNQLGYYTIALTASTIIYSITVSLSSVIYPSMQEAHGRSSNPEVLRGYIIRPTITMGILIPIFIAIMYFLVPTLVQRIIPQFIPGVVPFKIIVVFSYFFAMINMVASYLVVLNKQKMIITIYLCTILLIILISCLLTWAGWGLIGISLATGFGYLVCYAAMTIYVVRHWSAWDQTLVFLRDTMVPFLYEIPILIVIDHFHQPGSRGIIGMLVLDGAKILIFCLLFTPLVFLLEKKSNLMAGIIRPLLAKVKG
jgi:O-antigen/teichoic acid export membrane protein